MVYSTVVWQIVYSSYSSKSSVLTWEKSLLSYVCSSLNWGHVLSLNSKVLFSKVVVRIVKFYIGS